MSKLEKSESTINGLESTDQDRLVLRIQLPRCKRCNSAKFISYRTTKLSGDSVMRHARCRACNQKHLLIFQ